MSVELAPRRVPDLAEWARLELNIAASDDALPEAALIESCGRIGQMVPDAAGAAGAALSPDEINEFFSILLARVAHQDGNVAVAACAALNTLATANAECLASHPDVGHLFSLLCPFQAHRSSGGMRLPLTALVTIFSMIDAENSHKALVASGLISVVMRFLVHHLAVTLPQRLSLSVTASSPAGGAESSSDSSVTPHFGALAEVIDSSAEDAVAGLFVPGQMTRLLMVLLTVQLPLSVVAPMVPVVEQLMEHPDEDGNVARYACSCAANILRQSPQHRAAYEASITPRVFALVKHATAVVLRASSAPATRTTTAASVAGAGATPVEATPQSREEEVEWRPPEYLESALSFLTNFRTSTDTNVVRTTLMLLACLRKLPQTSPVLSAVEAALAFLMRHANGPVGQRHVLIDGGMLSSVFDLLAHMGHGDPEAYITACGTLYHLVGAEADGGDAKTSPIIDRVMAAAFAYGAVNDQGIPVPLWNLANGVTGYPVEIAALMAAKQSGAQLGGSVEKQAQCTRAVIQTVMVLMTFGLNDGSDFNSGGKSGKACANPRSWWHGLYRRMRALLKHSRDPVAVTLLQFCAAFSVTTDGSKGRFR